jgi:hypothetical protein
MTTRNLTMRICIKKAWWLPLYLNGVVLVSILTNRDPDWQKVERWVKRGIRIDMEPVK